MRAGFTSPAAIPSTTPGKSDISWTKTDLKALSGASVGAAGALVAKEGIYVQRVDEDVVLIPWSGVPVAARPRAFSTLPGRVGPPGAIKRGNGMIIRRNGADYSIRGRVVE